jgi:hypothetical protein
LRKYFGLGGRCVGLGERTRSEAPTCYLFLLMLGELERIARPVVLAAMTAAISLSAGCGGAVLGRATGDAGVADSQPPGSSGGSGSGGDGAPSGETIVTLASGQIGAQYLVLDSTNVYWTAESGVMEVPLDGGGLTILSPGRVFPAGMAIDPSSVYWLSDIDVSGASVQKVALAGGPVVTLAERRLPRQRGRSVGPRLQLRDLRRLGRRRAVVRRRGVRPGRALRG